MAIIVVKHLDLTAKNNHNFCVVFFLDLDDEIFNLRSSSNDSKLKRSASLLLEEKSQKVKENSFFLIVLERELKIN